MHLESILLYVFGMGRPGHFRAVPYINLYREEHKVMKLGKEDGVQYEEKYV